MRSVEKALLGRKLGMTQLFAEGGRAVAATVLAVGPCYVVQRRSAQKEGHDALQLGLEEPGVKRLNQPEAGHLKQAAARAGAEIPLCRHLVEFRFVDCDAYPVGTRLDAGLFAAGDRVDVIGVTKGKGFAGAQKRHGFSGGPASHGSMSHRRPASSGATDAARVFKGTRKPGHMGRVRRTVKGLRVHLVDPARNLLVVLGGVPGPPGGLVMVTRPASSAASAQGGK